MSRRGLHVAAMGALVLSPLLLAACSSSDASQACSATAVTSCHAHIDMQVSLTGSMTLSGELQRDASDGTLCTSGIAPGAIWSVPFPATPTPVDGHFVFGQGNILAAVNNGPGTYHASTVDGFEIVIDDETPFVPGSGTVTIHDDGSGSMALVGFSNGSAQIDASAWWTCTDVPG